MAENAPEETVRRHFEAYLLWLFGWVMFLGSHGDNVDKHMVWYTQGLVDWPVEEIQPYAWRPTVLCAMYRTLCNVSTGLERAPSLEDARCYLSCGLLSVSRLDDHSWTCERTQSTCVPADHGYGVVPPMGYLCADHYARILHRLCCDV